MSRVYFLSIPLLAISLLSLTDQAKCQPTPELDRKVDSVLNRLTLREKVGQLNQLRGSKMVENNQKNVEIDVWDAIRNGNVGSFLNVATVEDKIRMQRIAVEESASKVPLIFAMDVIHGFRTTFPVPLAEAASWDMEAIRRSAEIASIEATSTGVMWTFAPMVDVSYDARWGRSMEGGGEDPYLASEIAVARVKGFQGDDLTKATTMAATAKHFAGYGQVMAGREYNQTVISKRYLHEYVLPPFKAAAEAGCATFMNAFNDFDGIPCSGSKYLVTDILKKAWGFDGVVISDWDSFEEMVKWGVAEDSEDAARLAIMAGSDVDMMGLVYARHLEGLVEKGIVPEVQLDESVRRVLRLKFKLGLFDDPYRYFDSTRSKKVWYAPEHRLHAKDIAKKSMVLLRNEKSLLPLDPKQYRTIAVIGPIDSNPATLMSTWSAWGIADSVITFHKGIKQYCGPNTTVLYAAGTKDERTPDAGLLRDAIKTAKKADLIILTLGEGRWFAGENTSLVEPHIPECQVDLAKSIRKLNKPTVCVLANGRPIIFPWINENFETILEAWLPGTEAGSALADVLFGAYNPAGKLPVTFPYHVGQAPLSYLYKATGRPHKNGTQYKDAPNAPAYPFGYGLSYTTFDYSDLILSATEITKQETLKIWVTVTNSGAYDGEEVVQLYVGDPVATVTRPVKILKGFKKIFLKKGESTKVEFEIDINDLKYWDAEMQYMADEGEFFVYVGTNSEELLKESFLLK